MRSLIILAIALAGCSASQTAAVNTAVTDGQLVCKGVTGYMAVSQATGAPAIVTGKTAADVAATCAILNAVPVPVPPAGVTITGATVNATL